MQVQKAKDKEEFTHKNKQYCQYKGFICTDNADIYSHNNNFEIYVHFERF